ncbi:carbohydrate-binding module family 18 protein [Piromyces sp. E2]|nr:carbohydrate-binding module family 18 protein [Piromyces sp. E2]|eukprot:OUM57695.1 carbohydrate-binding module family 18 protein [Piromyces sp. E2]
MKKFINFTLLLSIIFTLFINVSYAKKEQSLKNKNLTIEQIIKEEQKITKGDYKSKDKYPLDNKNEPVKKPEGGDKFYLIFVNNTISTPISNKSKHQKRMTVEKFIDSLVNKIHNLIVDNVDTYEDAEKLEELDHESEELKKRDGQGEYLMDYGESNYVYLVSQEKDQSILYAYLSEELVEEVQALPNVIGCHADIEMTDFNYYNENDIKKETKWSGVTVRDYADLHLSTISQGRWNHNLIGLYDSNFYYPSTAGKDIDIFIFDTGFNFDHYEYSNKYERIVTCGFNVTNGKVKSTPSNTFCHRPIPNNHGVIVSDVAGGVIHGVANKANIYGIVLNELTVGNSVMALKFVRDNLLRANKAVFNFSHGFYFNDEDDAVVKYYEETLETVRQKGAVLIAAAGNDGEEVHVKKTKIIYPCSFENIICAGSIEDSFYPLNTMNPYNYVKASWSNYVEIRSGTSYSSPIVAGVAASIMSEHPEIQFETKSMLEYLTKLSIPGMLDIPTDKINDINNVFINNGKRSVYSRDNRYNGCGASVGNMHCPKGYCCSVDNQCTKDGFKCQLKLGCQSKFGDCEINYSLNPEGKCGFGYGKCQEGCCSSNGYCGTSSDHCGIGCQSNFGHCN